MLRITYLLWLLVSCGPDPSFDADNAGTFQDPGEPLDPNASKSQDANSKSQSGSSNCLPDDDFCSDQNNYENAFAFTDSFTQNQEDEKSLDLLVVVDNSGSMAQEQVNLGGKLAEVLGHVQTSDWKVAITSTDSSDAGTLAQLISKSDSSKTFAQKENDFATAVKGLGTYGSGNEMGIYMSVDGLSQGWTRSNAYIAVLIVSDEDNCSNGSCSNSTYSPATYLTNHLEQTHTLGDTAKVYGLHKRNNSECPNAANTGYVYNDAVTLSQGISGAICDSDYTDTLNAISADIAVTLDLSFPLSKTAIEETVKVYVEEIETNDFSLVDNAVVFNNSPAAGSSISIKYYTYE